MATRHTIRKRRLIAMCSRLEDVEEVWRAADADGDDAVSLDDLMEAAQTSPAAFRQLNAEYQVEQRPTDEERLA